MAKKPVSAMPMARDALVVLGQRIRMRRIERRWTAKSLAQRIGVSENTVLAIESGAPGTAIGTVFNAAVMVGFDLFSADREELARLKRQDRDTLALLPSRVDTAREDSDAHLYDF